MAGDRQPVSDEVRAALGERTEAQAAAIREALAEGLGGEPEEHRPGRNVAPAGGDE